MVDVDRPLARSDRLRRVDHRQLDLRVRGDAVEERRPVRRRLGRDERDPHRRPSFQAELPRSQLSRPRNERAEIAAELAARGGRGSRRGACRCGSLPPASSRFHRRLLAVVRLRLAAGDVRVPVGLMDRAHVVRRVDDDARPGAPSRRASCRSAPGRSRTAGSRRRAPPETRTSRSPPARASARARTTRRRGGTARRALDTTRVAVEQVSAEDDVGVDERTGAGSGRRRRRERTPSRAAACRAPSARDRLRARRRARAPCPRRPVRPRAARPARRARASSRPSAAGSRRSRPRTASAPRRASAPDEPLAPELHQPATLA